MNGSKGRRKEKEVCPLNNLEPQIFLLRKSYREENLSFDDFVALSPVHQFCFVCFQFDKWVCLTAAAEKYQPKTVFHTTKRGGIGTSPIFPKVPTTSPVYNIGNDVGAAAAQF